ncbi:MAG: sterol desaturase [Oleiphilaceae bacterium]|nr:sterol desaturase [Oleiphilaceae bacterium]
METIVVSVFFLACVVYEWLSGNYQKGHFSRVDVKMVAVCSVGISLVQRPIVMALVFYVAGLALAPFKGVLAPLEQNYFWWCLLGFILLEEYFHGLGHWFAHSRTPKTRWLQPLQKVFRTAHRPHHLIGNDDEKARMSVGQTFVEGWMYWFVMPNIWFSFIALYLGLTEVFVYGMIFKGVWALHVHTNWHYDLYFLNHRNPLVAKVAYALAHVFTFPTTHHHHHSRGKNSAKNLHNFLALYDWLIYGTLSIEKQPPERFGWRQNDQEKASALYRFTRTYQ